MFIVFILHNSNSVFVDTKFESLDKIMAPAANGQCGQFEQFCDNKHIGNNEIDNERRLLD